MINDPAFHDFRDWWKANVDSKWFDWDEVVSDSEVGGVRNQPPPPALYSNILGCVRIANTLRETLQIPIQVSSGYRAPAYNKAVRGDPASFHMQFKALDIYSQWASPKRIHMVLKQMQYEGLFKGGLKQYKTFVHFDTRGTNVTW